MATLFETTFQQSALTLSHHTQISRIDVAASKAQQLPPPAFAASWTRPASDQMKFGIMQWGRSVCPADTFTFEDIRARGFLKMDECIC